MNLPKQTMLIRAKQMQSIKQQQGLSLLITIVVLFSLTLIAITMTNTNQSSAIIVKNNQLRLEAFNISQNEINAQIDSINRRDPSQGPPQYINALIDNAINTQVVAGEENLTVLSESSAYATASDQSDEEAESANEGNSAPTASIPLNTVTLDLAMVYRGTCTTFGEEIGVNSATIKCNEFRVDVDTQLDNTDIGSDQRQVYEYKTLN